MTPAQHSQQAFAPASPTTPSGPKANCGAGGHHAVLAQKLPCLWSCALLRPIGADLRTLGPRVRHPEARTPAARSRVSFPCGTPHWRRAQPQTQEASGSRKPDASPGLLDGQVPPAPGSWLPRRQTCPLGLPRHLRSSRPGAISGRAVALEPQMHGATAGGQTKRAEMAISSSQGRRWPPK